jgi:hypothetical protein
MTDLLFDIPEEIKDIVNPNPRMFMKHDVFKAIIEFKKNYNHKKGLVKILTLFNPYAQFADRLERCLRYDFLGRIIDLKRYPEVDLGTIYIETSHPSIGNVFLSDIYQNLYQEELPLKHKNEDLLLKSMLERRLLIDFNDGDISNYLIELWTGDQNTITT